MAVLLGVRGGRRDDEPRDEKPLTLALAAALACLPAYEELQDP